MERLHDNTFNNITAAHTHTHTQRPAHLCFLWSREVLLRSRLFRSRLRLPRSLLQLRCLSLRPGEQLRLPFLCLSFSLSVWGWGEIRKVHGKTTGIVIYPNIYRSPRRSLLLYTKLTHHAVGTLTATKVETNSSRGSTPRRSSIHTGVHWPSTCIGEPSVHTDAEHTAH